MRILYIDTSEPASKSEDYSINPQRYGGGACLARVLKEMTDTFFIACKNTGFENLGPNENFNAFFEIGDNVYNEILSGKSVKEIFQDIEKYSFDINSIDIVLTHNVWLPVVTEGLKAKHVAWSVAGFEECSKIL